ncbi:hypothetical protein B0T16DRAFT_442635 [Cercophora newfieldiana]|uniref:EDC4-like protein pdc1 beta-propeller domain-containing protein n=1 Tax=Cercophora newfieldiana TaxID=92897 RepID=A0AA39YE98_9PEZI|nr:hypothetical protein B0T16DRAFT_442635 [Cercophora newfieldiana]
MSGYIPGGATSGDSEANDNIHSLLAQLRGQSSPSPGPGSGPGANSGPHGQYGYGQGGQSYYGRRSGSESPSNFQTSIDSPAFMPEAPTPPVGFSHSQYPPGMMNPIGTGRGAVGDERTAHLLNLLKYNGQQGGQSNSQQPSSREPPMNFAPAPIAPPVIHAPAPAAADPTGLLAALMKGAMQPEPTKPEPVPSANWSQAGPAGPSNDTQQYLLSLLNRPKPSQNDVNDVSQSDLMTPPPGDDDARDIDDRHRSAEPTLVDAVPSQSEFEFDSRNIESPHPKFDSTPHSQHSQAFSTTKFSAHGSVSNPFEDHHSGSSPVHRTPASTTPGQSASGQAGAAPIQILKKPDSAQSTHDQKRPLSDRGAMPSPEHTRRKLEHASSPLSQSSASRPAHMNASPFSDTSVEHRLRNSYVGDKHKESVAEAVSGLAEQADREAREALARAQDEQAQADIAQDLHKMLNARTEQEFAHASQAAAQGIKKELDREDNASLEAALSPDMAKEVKDIVDEVAQGSSQAVADSWESAEADEIVVIEEPEAPIKVYNFPMKPWITISLLDSDAYRPVFREESTLDIARLKKDFDQIDRNLVSASETYMAYGMSKAGGLRVIRQEDGKDAKLFTDTKDRIFNVAISASQGTPTQPPREAIIGTGVSGTVYWIQLKNGDRDHLEDAHPEQYGFALPPIAAQEGGDAPGGILKTRARTSSAHPEFFAVGRGKSINIIWPSFILEHNLFKQGHDRVVDTERLSKQCSLKINTGKAGKDFTFSQDDTLMVTLDKSGRVKFWDIRDLTAAREGSDPLNPMPAQTSLEVKEPLMTLTSTPEGEKAWPTSVLLLDKFRPYQKRAALRYMVVGMKQNHTLQLWDLALGKPVQEFNFPHNKESDAVCSVMYHAPSSMIVVGHPTRNSIYFLHLSAPKYTLKNLSQVEYVQRLVAQDASIPQPESTAVVSGIREYSFANKGVLRSLTILENPASSGDADEPTLFELYAMHSKGVTCLSIKQGELGWTKDNKVLAPADAVESGLAKITKLVAPATQETQPAPAPAETPTPQIRIATRSNKEASKTPASQLEEKKEITTPSKADRKDEVETPVPQTEGREKKGRKKKTAAAAAAAAAAAERELPASNGTADLGRTSSQNKAAKTPRPNDTTALALSNQFADLSLLTGGPQDIDALVSSMESRIVSNITNRFDGQFDRMYKQIQGFQESRESAFASSQTHLLQLVSDVLNDNTESVLKNLIIEQINVSVVPAIQTAVDKSVSEQLGSQASSQMVTIQKEIQRLLPGAVSQTMQRPDIVKGISDKVSHNVNAHVESQVAASLETIAKMAAQNVHQRVMADVSAQINGAFVRLEERRRSEDDKLDRLIAQTTDLSNAISSLAASQAAMQNEVFTLKQSVREQQRERELPAREPMHVHPLAHGGSGSHNKPGPSQDLVSYAPHQQQQQQHVQQPPHLHSHQQHGYGGQDQQVLFAPTTRENREKLELNDLMETIDSLMRQNNFDDAILRWLQSGNKTEEIFVQVLYKYDPVRLSDLQPLLLLSVGATITNDFSRSSDKIMEKIRWLEIVVFSLNQRVPTLDDQVREVTPKIMSLVKSRSEQLMMDISRIAPQDPSLKTLANLAHVAGRITDNQRRFLNAFEICCATAKTMRYRNLGLASCLVWPAAAWNHASEAQLQGALAESGYTLVAFVHTASTNSPFRHQPEEPPSKSLESEWTSMQDSQNDPNILSFDCAAHPSTCTTLEFGPQITAFPTIHIYHRDGRVDVYDGPPKAREIIPFLHRALRPPVLEIDAHPSLARLDDTVVMARIHPEDWRLYDEIYEMAGVWRYKMSFVGCAERKVPELRREAWEGYKKEGRQILHFVSADDEEKERYRKEVRGLLGRYKDKVKFVVTDPTAGLGDLPVLDGEKSGLVLEDTKTGELRRYSKDGGDKITGETVESFLKEVHGGAEQGQPAVPREKSPEAKEGQQKAGEEKTAAEEADAKSGTVHEEL